MVAGEGGGVGYQLGVDLGTTFTAAAVARDGHVEVVGLGDRTPEIPSVVFVREDGVLLVGDPAVRRGTGEPTRVAREFKRRLGDTTPIVLGGVPHAPEALLAAVLGTVVTEVERREGSPPDHVTLTYPANWGQYKQGLFARTLELVGAAGSSTASEPQAAAVHFASTSRVAPGEIIAVYDLGGGTFDAAVLRKTTDGFTVLGHPEGIEHLGGIDFDEAVFQYVTRALGVEPRAFDRHDEAVIRSMARLRADCVGAKETLSIDTEAVIPVSLPGRHTEVGLTRAQFEDMVRPALLETIGALRRALRSAQVDATDVSTTVLVGGSSRIPLIAELIGAELQLPVATSTNPKLTVALGAAQLAAERARPQGQDVAEVAPAAVHTLGGAPDPATRFDAPTGRAVATETAPPAAGVPDAVTVPAGPTGEAEDPSPPAAGVPDAVTLPAGPTGEADHTSLPPPPDPAPKPRRWFATRPAVVALASVAVLAVAAVAIAALLRDGSPDRPPEYASAATIATRPRPTDLAVVGQDLWVVSFEDGFLQRFDLGDPEPRLVDEVDLDFHEGSSGADIVVYDGALYVTQYDGGTVAVVDADSGALLERIEFDGRPLNGTVLGEALWFTVHPLAGSAAPGTIVEVEDREVTRTIDLDFVASGINAVGGELWVTFDAEGTVGRVDPTSGSTDVVDVGDEPTDLLAVADDVWVTLRAPDAVAVVERSSLEVSFIEGLGPQPYKLAAGLDVVFVTNAGRAARPGSVATLDPATGAILQTDIAVGETPIELAVADDRVYVGNSGGSDVTVIVRQ